LAESGFNTDSGAAVDLERGVVLVAGPTSFETIRNAIATAATYKLAKYGSSLFFRVLKNGLNLAY